MGLEKRAGITVMTGVLLVLSGLVLGYMGHDLLAPGPGTLSANGNSAQVVSKDSTAVEEPSAEPSASECEELLARLSEVAQWKEAGEEEALDSRPAGRFEQTQDPDAVWQESPQEGTADLQVELGGWDRDPNLDYPDNPDRVAEIVAEHEAEYHHHARVMAESVAEAHPPALEPDEDELEDQFLYEQLPEIDEHKMREMLEADEQALSLQQPQPGIPTLPTPTGEELPPPMH